MPLFCVVAVLALGLAVAAGARATPASAGAGGVSTTPATASGHSGARAALIKPPTKAALTLVELVRARSMGVDHAGNLWAWDPIEGTVRFFSPAGEPFGEVLVPKDSDMVDSNAEWGILTLADEGTRMGWVRPSAGGQDAGAVPASAAGAPAAPAPDQASAVPAGAASAAPGAEAAPPPAAPGVAGGTAKPDEIQLPEDVGWACWIDADTVAVSPRRAGHRVELWSLRQRKMLKSFGKEQTIVLRKGANRVRQVQLLWDASRRLLYTLESYTGDLEVFKLNGSLAWRAKAENPFRKVEDERLADLDARAKSHDTAYPQAFPDLWLAEGPDGSAWVRQGVDILKSSVTLLRSTAAGAAPRQVANLRCPGRTFTIWGDNLIFYRDIAVPREVCNSIAPLP